MTQALETVGLTKHFGRTKAVDGLDMVVPEGALLGFIGPNGAGKTTTFSLIAGFLRPSSGTIRVRGELLVPGVPRTGRLSVLPQDAQMPSSMRVLDVLVLLARLAGVAAAEADRRANDALERLGLAGESRDKTLGALSHGQRRRVAIAQTLLGPKEEIILLDEPTAGLDPRVAGELRRLIAELHTERTIVISSHNLAEIEAMCTHAVIIDHGKVVSQGTMDELKRSSALVTVILSKSIADVRETIVGAVRAIAGVRSAQENEDCTKLDLEMADDGETDARMNEVLKVLMDSGVTIRSVERGTSLEQRFLEETEARAP